MNCPISNRPLAINPNGSEWKTAGEGAGNVAIISLKSLKINGHLVYPAVHFDGTVHLTPALPEWATALGGP